MTNKISKLIINTKEFFETGIGGIVTGASLSMAVPSFVNQLVLNEKVLGVREKEKYSSSEQAGFGLGVLAGITANYLILPTLIEETCNGNYIPAAILGTTNAISLVFEGWNYFKKK